MSGDKKYFPCDDPKGYGSKMSANGKSNKPNLWTLLTGNGVISTRLTRALGLKDPPGHPDRADMSEVKITADMMQGGFSAYTNAFGYKVSPALLAVDLIMGGSLVGPTAEIDPAMKSFTTNPGFFFPFGQSPLLRNNARDMRVGNAMISYNPFVLNPSTDTNPQSLRVFFFLDGIPIFVQTQNNLVSSAADFEFFFQTADSYWNGIVPSGSYLSWIMRKSNGLTGASKNFDIGDIFVASIHGLTVPAGTHLPV
jgi:hypothetical protein